MILASAGRILATVVALLGLGAAGAFSEGLKNRLRRGFVSCPETFDDASSDRTEMRDVVTSLPPESLSAFKFDPNTTTTTRTWSSRFFHDIDSRDLQRDIVKHRSAGRPRRMASRC